MVNEEKLTLVAHLEEFRSRVIKSVIFVMISTCLVYGFVGSILPQLIKPVGKLVFIAQQEAFVANIKIAFFGGLFLSAPFVLFQVWRFVSTGLHKNETKYVRIFGPLSFLFFIAGTAFCYFVIIPISIRFLLGFATDLMTPMITVSKYISFVGTLTLTFGLVFELPLASLFLTKIGLVTPRFLTKKRKLAIVIIFVSAAILTPPDVITQCMMAVPLLALYEIGILFSKAVYKPKTI